MRVEELNDTGSTLQGLYVQILSSMSLGHFLHR